MKGIITFSAITLLFCSAAQAGWGWDKAAFHGAKSPMVEQRTTSPSYCYDAGFEFSAFGSGFWPEAQNLDNALGGGVGLSYFFGPNLGIELMYAAHGSGIAEQVGKGNIVYRWPLGGDCCGTIAPYIFGGPGVVSRGDSEFLWNVGGGIDFRLESWGCIGLFSDFSYNWVEDGISDFTMIRAGFRVPF